MRKRYGVRVWKTIRNGWETFKDKTRIQVGSRNRVKFWNNRWCGDLSLRDEFLGLYVIVSFKDAWVVVVWDEGSWGPRFIRHFNDWELEEVDALFGRLHNYSIHSSSFDVMAWLETKDGVFSIRSFYSSLVSRRMEPFPHNIVWNSWAPVRASFFSWEIT